MYVAKTLLKKVDVS